MLRTVRYRLRPTRRQRAVLDGALDLCCDLYNAALQERTEAWRRQRKAIRYQDQTRSLTELRQMYPDIAALPVDLVREPLRRLDRAFRGFFRRVRAGERCGYPRFRARERYHSLAISRVRVEGNVLVVPKLGGFRFRRSRPLRGTPRCCTLVRHGPRWSVSIVCEIGPAPAKRPVTYPVGIDLGLSAFVTLSDGRRIENPRWLAQSAAVLAGAQRVLARKRRGSRNWRRARRAVARCHTRIRNRRANFCHHVSKMLVQTYDLIAFEQLHLRGLARSRLAKPILDAAWGQLLGQLTYKAEEAGRWAVPVDPRGTTQRCAGCGAHVPKALGERAHRCPACGLACGRDHNAALNILALGTRAVGCTMTPERHLDFQ